MRSVLENIVALKRSYKRLVGEPRLRNFRSCSLKVFFPFSIGHSVLKGVTLPETESLNKKGIHPFRVTAGDISTLMDILLNRQIVEPQKSSGFFFVCSFLRNVCISVMSEV